MDERGRSTVSQSRTGITETHYATHAVEAMRAAQSATGVMGAMLDDCPNTKRIMAWFADRLESAVKFRVPDNGELLGDVRETDYGLYMDLMRPPFPVTAIEFTLTENKLGVQEGMELVTTRRLVLAMDLGDEATLADLKRVLGPYFMPAKDAELAECTLVWSIDDQTVLGDKFGPDMPTWLPASGGLLYERRSVMGDSNRSRAAVWSSGLVWFGEVGLASINRLSERIGRSPASILASEASIERVAVVGLCAALACRNVGKALVPAPDALNRKRIKSGKVPFFSYHELVIDSATDGTSTGTARGSQPDRRTPRKHLRRGHIRRLPQGNTWVSATVVNAQRAATVAKDYRVS